MDNIIQVNTAESQTIDVYYQDSVDLELDVQLMYIKSGEAEIKKYVDEVAKPEIDGYIQNQAEPIVADVVERIAEPTVNEYLDTVTKPSIDKYVDGKKPELQAYVDQTESNATSAAGFAANALASEENAAQSATNAAQSAESSELSAQSAAQSANGASESAELAQSWAIGEIGTRPEGSAKYWAERAAEFYPVGAIIAYPTNEPKKGWLVCDGSAVGREDYSELFALIGTTFGEGDGKTTFNLPNFINRTFWGGTSSGTYFEAGLPNITGAMANIGGRTGANYAISTEQIQYSGAFYRGESRGETASLKEIDGVHYNQLCFDASRSSSKYGASDTVQPAALQTLIIIKY